MFTRFVHAKAKPGRFGDFKRLYNEQVLPVLQQTPGCLFACLIQSVEDPNELISCTLWDSQASAQAYEQGGTYTLLLEKARDILTGSTEWKVQLTKDLKLEYTPVQEEPVVRSYRTTTAAEAYELSQAMGGPMYVRLTSWKVGADKLSELKHIYENDIIPVLRTVSGYRYAFLIDSPEESEAISVTIWDSKDHADEYEQSGIFDQLVGKIRHTFSQVYQWKMKLAEETHAAIVTSEELTVKPYQVVVGKQLK